MMLLWPWAKPERRAVCAERRTYGSGRRSAKALLTPFPVNGGFLYLVAVMDWAPRKVLSSRLSNTMDARFCVEALQEAITRFGTPEIFNTDQGSQFTSAEFTDVLRETGIRISMDGRMDNIFIERLWRSLKYECIYLHEMDDGFIAKRHIHNWTGFYNTQRPHSTFNGRTPDEVFGLDGNEKDEKLAA